MTSRPSSTSYVDLAAKQADTQVIVDITRRHGQFTEGIAGQGSSYVANIILPPKEYEEVDTGETEEDGRPKVERRVLALDTNRVVVKLWKLLPDQAPEILTEEE
jgi:hypothetical protein